MDQAQRSVIRYLTSGTRAAIGSGRNWLARRQHIVAIVTSAVVMASILTAFTPVQAAHAWWQSDQNSCSSLYPTPTPNHFMDQNTGTWYWESPPAGYGSAMTNPFTGGVAQFSWDGSHYIISCNSKNYYAEYNSTQSNTGTNYISGGYGAAFQCAELIARYAFARWNDPVRGTGSWSGNAANFWTNHPSHFIARSNGDSHEVQVGNIIVYGQVDSSGTPQPNWGAGHVAIVIAVNYSDTISYSGGTYYGPTVTVFEQNWGKTYGVHKEYLRRVHADNAYWDTLGTSTYNSPVWNTGPGGSSIRDSTSTVVYGWLQG